MLLGDWRMNKGERIIRQRAWQREWKNFFWIQGSTKGWWRFVERRDGIQGVWVYTEYIVSEWTCLTFWCASVIVCVCVGGLSSNLTRNACVHIALKELWWHKLCSLWLLTYRGNHSVCVCMCPCISHRSYLPALWPLTLSLWSPSSCSYHMNKYNHASTKTCTHFFPDRAL